MRMLWCSILSVVLLVSLAQANPLEGSNVENESEEKISSVLKENGNHLPNNVYPNDYTIQLEPHLAENDFTFNGKSQIDIIINEPAPETIVLHAVDLEIEKEFTSLIHVTGNTNLKPTKQSLDAVMGLLTIAFTNPIAAGTYTLNLKYTGKLKEDQKGFYRIQRQVGEQNVWDALTQFKPSYARRAFPCFDETDMKSRFTISIKRPENYVANSTVLTVRSNDDEDKSLTRFESIVPVSTDDIDFKVFYVKADVSVGSTTAASASSIKDEVPASSTDASASSTDASASSTDASASSTDASASSTDASASSTDASASSTDASASSTDASASSRDASASSTDASASSTDASASSTDASASSTDASASSTDASASSTDASASSTDASASSTDASASSTDASASSTDASASSTDASASSTDASASSTDASASSTDASASSTDASASSTDASASSTDASASSTDASASSTDASASSTDASASSTDASASSTDASAIDPTAAPSTNSVPNISLPTFPLVIFIGLLARLVTQAF